MGKIAQTEDILKKTGREYGDEAVFTSSFGAEDMVIAHLISKLDLDIEIATIDTGRLHQNTYDFIDRAVKFYGLKLKSYFPEAGEVEEMVRESGHNLFYYSQENVLQYQESEASGKGINGKESLGNRIEVRAE